MTTTNTQAQSFSIAQSETSLGRKDKAVFNVADVQTVAQTQAFIKSGQKAQRKANDDYQMACIGAAYQVLAYGNTTQVKELLGSLGLKSQRYQKIFQVIKNLTGEMVTITESGSGAKRETMVAYKYSEEAKTDLLGDIGSEGWSLETTKFHKEAQKPWWTLAVDGGENYEIDAAKFFSGLSQTAARGGEAGLDLEEMLDNIRKGWNAGNDKREEEETKKKAAAEADTSIVKDLIADLMFEVAGEDQASKDEIKLVRDNVKSGDMNVSAALGRLKAIASTYLPDSVEMIDAELTKLRGEEVAAEEEVTEEVAEVVAA